MDLHHLRVVVDALVDDHQVSGRAAVLENGRGVHGDVDHALLHLFVERVHDLVRVRLIPAALHRAGVVDDAAGGEIRRLAVCAASQQEHRRRDDEQHQQRNERAPVAAAASLLMGIIRFCHVPCPPVFYRMSG